MKKVEPFFVTPFQGVLALFLLEMGIVAGRRLGELRKGGSVPAGLRDRRPGAQRGVGRGTGQAGRAQPRRRDTAGRVVGECVVYRGAGGDPHVASDANPTLSLTASLAVTFPFNITVGIPLCLAMARRIYS